MKAITINVSEPLYREFQARARRQDRTAAELIREAMEEQHKRWGAQRTSLRGLVPLDLGRIKRPLSPDDDLLGEMLE